MAPTDKPEVKEVEFFYPQHTVAERVDTEGAVYGGPYLDDVQRLEAEKLRAEVEGRKPDLKNPSAIAGTPLLTARQINADGLVNGAKPDQVLGVVVGDPEVDDDGHPTGNKSYLKVKPKKNKVTNKQGSKQGLKKAAAAPVTSK